MGGNETADIRMGNGAADIRMGEVKGRLVYLRSCTSFNQAVGAGFPDMLSTEPVT